MATWAPQSSQEATARASTMWTVWPGFQHRAFQGLKLHAGWKEWPLGFASSSGGPGALKHCRFALSFCSSAHELEPLLWKQAQRSLSCVEQTGRLSGLRAAVNAVAALHKLLFKSSKNKSPHAVCSLQAESHDKYFAINEKNLFLGASFSLGIW